MKIKKSNPGSRILFCQFFILLLLTNYSYSSTIELQETNYIRLVSRHNNTYLHTENGIPETLTNVPKHWHSAMWVLEPVTGTNYVRIKNRWKNNYLHTENGTLELKTKVPSAWHSAIWELEQIPETDYVRLKCRWNGNYMHTENGKPELMANVPKHWYSAMWKLEGLNGNTQKWKSNPLSNNSVQDFEIVKVKNFGEGCFNTIDGHSKNNKHDIGTAINARVYMNFELIGNSIRANTKVTMGNNESIKAKWSRVIYKGGNRRIASFDPTYSSGTQNFKRFHRSQTIEFEIPKGGFEFGGCNDGDIKTVKASYGTIKIIGDTGGSDISDDLDCSCDSKLVDVLFKDMAVKYTDDSQKDCSQVNNENLKPNYEFTIFEPDGFEFTFTGKDKFNPNDFEAFFKPNKQYRYRIKFYDTNGLKNIIFQTSSKDLRLTSSASGSGWEFNQSGFGYEYRWEGDRNNKECEVSFLGRINFNEIDIARNEVFIINMEDFNGDNLYHQSHVTIPKPKEIRKERVRYFNNSN